MFKLGDSDDTFVINNTDMMILNQENPETPIVFFY